MNFNSSDYTKNLSPKVLEKFNEYGITTEDIQKLKENPKYKDYDLNYLYEQLEVFENGIPPLPIEKAATPQNNGISVLDDNEKKEAVNYFEQNRDNYKILKFVPASGAATRMFKHLFEFLKTNELSQLTIEFFQNIEKFAFFDDLKNIIFEKENEDIFNLLKEKNYRLIAEYLLTDKGLNLGSLPKGLIKFHKYNHEERTPLNEHIYQGICYASSKNSLNLHFTVSPDHLEKFNDLAQKLIKKYSDKIDIKIDFSIQNPNTDTISVLKNNKKVYKENGQLFLRPAGHGALLENLNNAAKKYDIIFLRNIDNVLTDKYADLNCFYQKILAGVLLKVKDKVHEFLKILSFENIDNQTINNIAKFVETDLKILLPKEFHSFEKAEKIKFLKQKLNRPIRVAGMVKNEGQPGGGPFWVKNKDNSTSLQIVELVQINEDKKELLQAATHFNPVNIVVWTKDFEGKSFDFTKYIDKQTYILTEKNRLGTPIKVLELPGLWNGSMSDWITIFVEIPIDIFNPVKTVNDLLKPKHQN